ncbi:sialidase-1-like isoform X1 [Porites lutea]|uniref:sialidase-1-like isoform X1 n=1 Tax=Porites lutea TaxID=51062 RepID=UPI003CC55946
MMATTTSVSSLLGFVLFVSVGILPSISNPTIDHEVTLWKQGDLGVNTYRIPIITSLPDGSLIALAEGRKHSSGDSGPKFLAIRRSKDQGITWSNTSFLEDDGEAPDGLNLGTVIVDEEVYRVFVVYSFCAHKCVYHTTFLISSDDFGLSWSKPYNLSEQIGTSPFLPGPGFGIQKKQDPHRGRLITCGHTMPGHDGVYCIVSDDHGKSWRIAGNITQRGSFEPDESQLIELNNGVILMSSRNQGNFHCHCRIMSKSYDGAESFAHADIYVDETLEDPVVAASLLGLRTTVYFSNPANKMFRVNMTLRWSKDNGASWNGALTVWKGASGYSCLAIVPGMQANETFIGLVFEKGHLRYYESIVFVRFRLE